MISLSYRIEGAELTLKPRTTASARYYFYLVRSLLLLLLCVCSPRAARRPIMSICFYRNYVAADMRSSEQDINGSNIGTR